MATRWEFRLKNAADALKAIITEWVDFQVSHTVNAPSVYALKLRYDDPAVAEFDLDGQLEGWREDVEAGITEYAELEAFCIDEAIYRDANKALYFDSAGLGYPDLLARTIIDEASGSSLNDKAETLLKDYVDDHAGPSAPVARQRSGLTIEADGLTGNAIQLQRPNRNLLIACQDIAKIGGGDFDVVSNGVAAFKLNWYLGQRGTDRTATVIFSEDNGNMGEPRLEKRYSRVKNAVLVGGGGEGTDRTRTWVTDAASIAESTWNRREAFSNAAGEDDAALSDQGDAVIAENDLQFALSFIPVQTPASKYGRDYFLGDKVTAVFMGMSYTKKVYKVGITVNTEGERIAIEMIDV